MNQYNVEILANEVEGLKVVSIFADTVGEALTNVFDSHYVRLPQVKKVTDVKTGKSWT